MLELISQRIKQRKKKKYFLRILELAKHVHSVFLIFGMAKGFFYRNDNITERNQTHCHLQAIELNKPLKMENENYKSQQETFNGIKAFHLAAKFNPFFRKLPN